MKVIQRYDIATQGITSRRQGHIKAIQIHGGKVIWRSSKVVDSLPEALQ